MPSDSSIPFYIQMLHLKYEYKELLQLKSNQLNPCVLRVTGNKEKDIKTEKNPGNRTHAQGGEEMQKNLNYI